MKRKGSLLQRRLYLLVLVCLVPLTILIMYLLVLLNRFSDRYNAITDNIMLADTYSVNFKKDMDYTMYVIVTNRYRAREITPMSQPNDMIDKAFVDFNILYGLADSEHTQNRISEIIQCLNELKDSVEEIEKDSPNGDSYDTNMERLDTYINAQTELIQEKVQEYIYTETTHLDEIKEQINEDVTRALWTSMVIWAGILLVAVIISRKIMTGITGPIHMLSEAVKQAGSGDFEVRASEDEYSYDELAVLNVSFNQMVEKIGQLVEDIRIEQINLRQAELKVLQAQINPHFLYNTLDSIIWLAEVGKKEQVVQMVSSLSDFFRTTLSKGRDYITLQEEETHIRSYLQIQHFRYRDILEYDIQIPESLWQYKILKLTLQPLVENALYHGIKNKRGVGHIVVTGKEEGDNLIFCVSDDGIGMTPERLDYVRALIRGEKSEEDNPTGFGLFNVNQRLQLNYGTSYGLKMDSVYGEGSKVTVIISKNVK